MLHELRWAFRKSEETWHSFLHKLYGIEWPHDRRSSGRREKESGTRTRLLQKLDDFSLARESTVLHEGFNPR